MDLIIEDEYIEQMGEYLLREAEDIESKINQYIAILDEVCAGGIMEGETSKALAEFREQVAGLRGIADNGLAAKRYCLNYIDRIDDADRELYDKS